VAGHLLHGNHTAERRSGTIDDEQRQRSGRDDAVLDQIERERSVAMLYLNPPYFVINGVSVFPDHLDPLQFYYLPMMPRLTTARDSASGLDLPQIQLIEYAGSAGTGGFINFDVNIGIDQDKLDDVTAQLRRQAHLSDAPRLSPVTFVDGTVRLLILGAESPEPPAPSAGGRPGASTAAAATGTDGPKFVVKIQNAAKPALYGDNQATFSVQLDQYGATVLQQALRGEMAPIAVVYSLDFIGLRPAFNVRLNIDWDRVQKYLDEHFSTSVLFFASDVEKAVNSLIESRAITIDVDTFVADTEPSSHSLSADRDRAVAECYELIKSNFFESSLPPQSPTQPDDWDKAVGAFKNISDIALTGGMGSPAFSYKKVDTTRIDKKRLDFNVSERTAVQRSIYPQGHFTALASVLQNRSISADRFILKVNLDDPWFQRRRLTVKSNADFTTDSISSIDVSLKYNDVVKSATLGANGASSLVDWSSVLTDGAMQRPVSYGYTVNFKDVDTTQRPGQLVCPERVETSDVINIDPRDDLYGVTVIPIRAENVPWDRYPNVEVECRYVDQANGVNLQASALLSSQLQEVNWPLFIRDKSRREFDYRMTFTLATGGTTVTPWITTGDGKIDVLDPFPSKARLSIVPALDWNVFDQALVFAAYPNKQNPLAQQSYVFSKNSSAAQNFVADRRDTSQNQIYYEVRMIKRSGQLISVPGSVTTDAYLILQPDMKGHQIITIQPEQVDFGSLHVSTVEVDLRYVDSNNKLNLAKRFTFSSIKDIGSFAFDYCDPAISAEYRMNVQLDNGQNKTVDWSPIGDSSLTIQLSQFA
jgi:hypothetical protein